MNSPSFWIARLIAGLAGLGLQLAGLYAAYVAFGGWITLALYGVGALALLLQQIIVRRVMSCSPGD